MSVDRTPPRNKKYPNACPVLQHQHQAQRDAPLVDGKPATMPARCELVFAVLVAGRPEAAVVYFAPGRLGAPTGGRVRSKFCPCSVAVRPRPSKAN